MRGSFDEVGNGRKKTTLAAAFWRLREVAMKAKPAWKSSGHSAKKFREMPHRRGTVVETLATTPLTRKHGNKKVAPWK
jgi:hypothetical protein